MPTSTAAVDSAMPQATQGAQAPKAAQRQSARTGTPRSRSWWVHSLPVRPVAPNTATDMRGGARSAFAAVARRSNFIIMAARLVSKLCCS